MRHDAVKAAMVSAAFALAETLDGVAWDEAGEGGDPAASEAATEFATLMRRTAFALDLAPSVISSEFAQALAKAAEDAQRAATEDNDSWQKAYEEAVARYEATLPKEPKCGLQDRTVKECAPPIEPGSNPSRCGICGLAPIEKEAM